MTSVEEIIASVPEHCFGMTSRVASRATTRIFASLLAPLGLEVTQFPIMVMLRLHNSILVSELSKLLDIEASGISRNIQALERKGAVISTGGRGRNGKHVALSAEGEVLLNQAVLRWQEAQKMLIAELGEDETIAVRKAMKNLSAAAQRILSREKEMR